MANSTPTKTSLPHIERTAAEPREENLHPIILSQISQINSSIRLLRLTPTEKEPIKFHPGQWLDLHIPGIPSPGGFTLTSTPSQATQSPSRSPFLELAIQKPPPESISSAPAAWLWQTPSQILNTELRIRVGGSFIWPPPTVPLSGLERVVFVAGGVGINPLISMLGSIAEGKGGSRNGKLGFTVAFLYSVRNPWSEETEEAEEEILFLSRLRSLFGVLGDEGTFRLFVTGSSTGTVVGAEGLRVERRRIEEGDLLSDDLLGSAGERSGTVCYVCGVPGMTDRFVDLLGKAEGMSEERVLSEKWW